MPSLLFVSIAFVLPLEFHIDCSGWHGRAVVEVKVRVTARDGTVLNSAIEVQPDTSAEQVCFALGSLLERTGHRGHKVGKSIFVLEGAKKSAIRSVEFKSDGWKPDVRVVFKLPKK